MSDKTTLGDRCKTYEDVFRQYLPPRIPKIIRIDGKAFHSILKKAERPYDKVVMQAIVNAVTHLMKEIGGTARFAYLQSDEISIALNDFLDLETDAWFDNNLQKIVSVSASYLSAYFTLYKPEYLARDVGVFDARIFCVPEADLNNVIFWRQLDAARNSVQQYARTIYSQKQLHGKRNAELQEMMFQKGLNWNDQPTWTKRGLIIKRTADGLIDDWDIPLFNEDKQYLSNLFFPSNDVE